MPTPVSQLHAPDAGRAFGLLTANFRSLDPNDTLDLAVNLGSVNPYQDGSLAEATLIGQSTGFSSLELRSFFGGNLNDVKFSLTGFEIVGSGLSAERWLFLSSPGLMLDRKPSSAQALTLGNIDTFYANIRTSGVEFGDPSPAGWRRRMRAPTRAGWVPTAVGDTGN